MKLTNEQIAAMTAYGLLIMNEPESLAAALPIDDLCSLSADIDKHLSPLVPDDSDMVTPILDVLRDALRQFKETT